MSRKTTIIVIIVAWIIGITCFHVFALTTKEREKAKKVLVAIEAGIQHIKALQIAAEQARIEADNANAAALLAAESAEKAGVTAKKAQTEAERCQKENAEMRPIVAAVTGPWWFPGGRALLYGAKKSTISLLVIIAGIVVIGILLKIFAPGVYAAIKLGGKAVGGFGRIVGGFFSKYGKTALAAVTRKNKTVAVKQIDRIKHRTIGSDEE